MFDKMQQHQGASHAARNVTEALLVTISDKPAFEELLRLRSEFSVLRLYTDCIDSPADHALFNDAHTYVDGLITDHLARRG